MTVFVSALSRRPAAAVGNSGVVRVSDTGRVSEEVNPIFMFASLSRRFVALALFCAALFGATPSATWAQKQEAGQMPPLRSSTGRSFGNAPLSRLSGMGDTRFLPSGITRRSTVGVRGFEKAGKAGSTRAQIGGTFGGDVQEKIVDVTVTNPATDERTPYWTSDEKFLYYASNQGVNTDGTPTFAVSADGKYKIFRSDPSASLNTVNGKSLPTILTDPNDGFDYLFPTLNASSNQIAFLRSSDGKPVTDTTKKWDLYVANVPATGTYLDVNTGGAGNLTALTAGQSFPTDATGTTSVGFATVGRPTFIGSNEIIFSGKLTGQSQFHLFQVNIGTNRLLQLTAGPANEQNPAVTPDALAVAFDSDANATLGVGGAEAYPTAGTPRTVQLPGNIPTTATAATAGGNHNIFVMRLTTGAAANQEQFRVSQFSNRQAGATISDNIQPAWSFLSANQYTNPGPSQGGNSSTLYLAWASDRSKPGSKIHDIVYTRASDTGGGAIQSEGVLLSTSGALQLDTADPSNTYDDIYPTFAPFIRLLRVGFQSDRNGNYVVDGFPTPPSGADANGFVKTTPNSDIYIATLIDISAPTLLRYDTNSSTGELVHINVVRNANQPYEASTRSARTRDDGLLPGTPTHFAVRVEDRESGLRPTQAVYLQIKNPNSTYQGQAQGSSTASEHKEFDSGRPAFIYYQNVNNANIPITYNLFNGNPAGAEYEAEALSILNQATGAVVNEGTYFQHRRGTHGPNALLYEAGLDDQLAFSGSSNPPLDGTNGTKSVWLELKPLFKRNADGSVATDANGNAIPEVPSDGQGGVLYGATLTLPKEASDWYIDVIAYDNAKNPFSTTGSQSNWIIYDNVWGFSTATPISAGREDVLVVADYVLGQKFFQSRFSPLNTSPGTVGTVDNLLPIRFGAESYYTDVDENAVAAPTGVFTPPTVTTPNIIDPRGPFSLDIQLVGSPFGLFPGQTGHVVTPNTLGIRSYTDELLLPFGQIIGARQAHLPDSGRYSIWRVLSRGTVPTNLLQAYLPQKLSEPADIRVNPASNTRFETTPRAIQDVERVVVWTSPFTGDVFAGPGTLLDRDTQDNLTNFVSQGGRLFISGQDIAFALKGSGGNQASPFFDNVLQASFINDDANDRFITASGSAGSNPYSLSIQKDPWSRGQHAYGHFASPFYVYFPPNQNPTDLILTNITADFANNRGDASFTARALGGRNDLVAPKATSTKGPLANLPSAYAEFNYGGGTAMIHSYYGSSLGQVVYAAFGFESLSNNLQANSATGALLLLNLGRRAEIMHNFTCSTRTGTLVGRIIDNNGQPVVGALVRAVPNIASEATLASGTALTDASGNYNITGLTPDQYVIFGYKPGYYTQHSSNAIMHGASRAQINLSLKAANPGTLGGFPLSTTGAPANNLGGIYEADGVTPVAGIEVQARYTQPDGTIGVISVFSSDGVTADKLTGKVLPKGAYLFPALPINDPALGGYTIIANPTDRYASDGKTLEADPNHNNRYATVTVPGSPTSSYSIGAGTTQNPDGTILVTENSTSKINFFLGVAPQPIKGRVLDQDKVAAGNTSPGIANASVVLRDATGTSIASATTDASGNYQLALISPATGQDPLQIPGGTYTITVTAAPGYAITSPPSSVVQVSVSSGGNSTTALQAGDLLLKALPPGSVSGLVTFSIDGTTLTTTGVAGAIVNLYPVINPGATNESIGTTATSATVAEPATTLADGYVFNYKFNSVPAGEYLAVIVPLGSQTALTSQIRITVTSGVETRNVNFTLQPPKIYPKGLQLISLPLDFPGADPRDIFTFGSGNSTGFAIAEWTGTEYRTATTDAELKAPRVPIRLGKGYFVRFNSTAAVNPKVAGTTVNTPTYTISLVDAWNLIGHPFVNQTDRSKSAADLVLSNAAQVTFTYSIPNGVSRVNASLDTAVADGAVQRNVYQYLSQTGNYVSGNTLTPYIGYWFRAYVPVQMVVTYPGAGRSAHLPEKVNGKYSTVTVTRAQLDAPKTRAINSKGLSDWRLQLAARQGDMEDTDNTIGVSPEAKDGFDNRFDSEKPPLISDTPGVYLSIGGTGPAGRSAALTDSVIGATGGKKSWTFTVQTTASNSGDVTVFWPNVSRLPRGIEPILVDTETGRRVAMRSGAASYRYATNGRATHVFTVEVAPPSSLPMDIVNLRSIATRVQGGGGTGNSVRFAFTTTREADVDADIQTLTGKSIRHLSTRAVSGTESSLTWDYRDRLGARIPAGNYVLSITARDSTTGATVRRQLMILSLQ